MRTLLRVATVGATLMGGIPGPLQALQDQHILQPVAEIEQALRDATFQIASVRGSRAEGDRTQRVTLVLGDGGPSMEVKWAVAPLGGETFNNVPRYEVAAYEIQKLFLDEQDYVVPPTVLRSMPLAWYRTSYNPNALPTFGRVESVIIALQYWLAPPLQPHKEMDRRRAAQDDLYARYVGNLNVLSYLIRHRDNNDGNFLISGTAIPRVFAVDNGVAFRSEPSDRGHYWSILHATRIPLATAERLRAIGLDDLERSLGVLAQFELRNGHYERAESAVNLAPGNGIRRRASALQFGLTSAEIREVHGRLQRLVQLLDSGRITTF